MLTVLILATFSGGTMIPFEVEVPVAVRNANKQLIGLPSCEQVARQVWSEHEQALYTLKVEGQVYRFAYRCLENV